MGEANPREENNSQTAKQFPNELVSEIARNCFSTDLINLSLVNKAYQSAIYTGQYHSLLGCPRILQQTGRRNACNYLARPLVRVQNTGLNGQSEADVHSDV